VTPAQWAVWAWGVGGVVLILLQAILRLAPRALEVFDGTLTAGHWLAVIVWTAFMIYSEAWRGFHKQFSPRVVVRSLGVARDPVPWRVVLAPIVAMGLVYGTRKRLIVSRALLVGIVALIVGVRLLPHPWRAIVDVGVVIGLLLGTLSIVWFAVRAVRGRPPEVAADFP
jgi:hypothetical protein